MSKPIVTCAYCRRQAECIRAKDGTLYRPFAWTYPDAKLPMIGICQGCLSPPEGVTYEAGEEADGRAYLAGAVGGAGTAKEGEETKC